MAKAKKIFAIHPGEILKTEFMEPMGVSAYALAKALNFPGIYEVVRGDRAISADPAIRLGKYFALPAQFWLNLQNGSDLRIAEGSGIGRGIRTRNNAHDAALTGARSSGRNPPEKVGSLAGIRTPILCSRGRCPTVERRGYGAILNHFAATAKRCTLAGGRAEYETRVKIFGSLARSRYAQQRNFH